MTAQEYISGILASLREGSSLSVTRVDKGEGEKELAFSLQGKAGEQKTAPVIPSVVSLLLDELETGATLTVQRNESGKVSYSVGSGATIRPTMTGISVSLPQGQAQSGASPKSGHSTAYVNAERALDKAFGSDGGAMYDYVFSILGAQGMTARRCDSSPINAMRAKESFGLAAERGTVRLP